MSRASVGFESTTETVMITVSRGATADTFDASSDGVNDNFRLLTTSPIV